MHVNMMQEGSTCAWDSLQASGESGSAEQPPGRPPADTSAPAVNGMKGDEESGQSLAQRRAGCCGIQEPLLFFTLIGESPNEDTAKPTE